MIGLRETFKKKEIKKGKYIAQSASLPSGLNNAKIQQKCSKNFTS